MPNETKEVKTTKKEKNTLNILSKSPIKIYALGGLGEVGKNIYCFEDDKSIIIVDCGVMFPDDSLLGVNYVIPDFTYLIQNQEKIRALIITHGHEDHIGGIPFILQLLKIPVIYAPKLAIALIRNKINDFKLRGPIPLIEYNENSIYHLGDFTIRFFHVTHSIPDSYGIIIDTPQGRIVETGDFKIDLTPIDADFNITKLIEIGNEGIDLLMADSTNAEKEGYTPSEKSVIFSILDTFQQAYGRIIISTFSSNISRIAQIVDATRRFNKKLCVIGRSMEANINSAREFGYIKIKDSDLIDVEKINNYKKNEIVILCTGSQGEPLAALSRIANNEHKYIHIVPGDSVIFSSSPIPGNTQGINTVVNKLIKAGATVYQNDQQYSLHASGHPSKQELRLLQKLARPKYFMPVHGEYRMLKIHAELAQEMGMPKENTFVCSNGDVLNLFNHKVTRSMHTIGTDSLYIDGMDAVSLSTSVIKDRNIISNEGMVAIYIILDSQNSKLLNYPIVRTNGFMMVSKSNIIYRISDAVYTGLQKLLAKERVTYQQIKDTIRQDASRFIYYETKRRPMIIPVVLTKNKDVDLKEIKQNG